jgi:hypothetical protein
VKIKGATVMDIVAAVFLLAVVTMLVRPSSLFPEFLKLFGEAMDGMITFAVIG